jgi:DNA (cytosine-5)-methyltransferase 1
LCRGNNVSGDVGLCSGEQFKKAIGNASQFEITGSSQESETMAQDVPDTAQHRLQRSSKTGNFGEINSKTQGQRTGQADYVAGSCYWAVEPNVGRVANGVPKRVDRLKGLGNAIVPQVVYEIMKKL